jgi:hypothetical protein
MAAADAADAKLPRSGTRNRGPACNLSSDLSGVDKVACSACSSFMAQSSALICTSEQFSCPDCLQGGINASSGQTRAAQKANASSAHNQKKFSSDTGPGTPEERKRHPLAPRQVNVVAQQDAQGSLRNTVDPVQTSKSSEAISSVQQHIKVAPQVGTDGGSHGIGQLPTGKGNIKEDKSQKHAQYLSRLHRLMPALRSSASDPSNFAATKYAQTPLQFQAEQQPHHPPSQSIGTDWMLYPIMEKGKGSPDSTDLSPTLPIQDIVSSQQMTWQHALPDQVGTAGEQETTSGSATAGVLVQQESESQPMDLSADEVWENEGYAVPSTAGSSPTPSFPSPTSSPPEPGSGDWLGGGSLWRARPSDSPKTHSQVTLATGSDGGADEAVRLEDSARYQAWMVVGLADTSACLSTSASSSTSQDTASSVASSWCSNSGAHDTVDALLAIDAAVLAGAQTQASVVRSAAAQHHDMLYPERQAPLAPRAFMHA